jgi:hypothetical protein
VLRARLYSVALALGMTSLLGSIVGTANAQGFDAEVRIDQLHPPTAGSPFTRAEGPVEPFEDGIAYAIRLAGDYQLAPVRSTIINEPTGDDNERNVVAHAFLGHLAGSITPLHWMTIELNLAAGWAEGEADERLSQQQLSAGEPGFGDIRVGAHFRAMNTPELDLQFGARVWAPTGTSAAYLAGSDQYVRFEVVPAVAGEIDLLLYGCTLGLAPLFFAGRDGDRIATSCAALFKLAPMIALGVEPHVALFTFSEATSRATSAHAPGLGNADVAVMFEPLASAAFSFGGFSLGVAGGPGFGNAPGTPRMRAMFTLSYADRGERVVEEVIEDSDLDGLPDEYDACPNAAGTKERRGCPDERDLDGDGIIDGDACPDEPGAQYDDPDANGCPDRDNDHIADPVDPCPIEPGESSGGCPQYARFEAGNFEIEPPISFARRRATLSETGRAALIEVIRTMRANPKIEQVSIAIGAKRASQKLTDKRAAAILAVLNDQNFDSSRYEVVLSDDLKSGAVVVRVVK